MKKVFKIFLVVGVALFLLYIALGFWGVPWVITNKLPAMLTEELNRPVTIQEASFNPFLFKLQVKGFGLQETDESPIAGFDELFVDFEPLSSLKNQAYTFAHIRLGLPYGFVMVRPDGSVNVAEMGQQGSADDEGELPQDVPEGGEEAQGLPAILIEVLAIQQGMVEFVDASRPTPFEAHLVPINLTLEQFSTQKGRANPYALSAELQDEEKISWEGTLTLEPVQSQGSLTLENIQLSGVWAYLHDQFRFLIPQGVATLKGQYELSVNDDDVDVVVNHGTVTVKDVQIQKKGASEAVIDLPFFEVDGVSVDIGKQEVRIPTAKSQDARLTGWLDEEGEMNYQTLFTPVDADKVEASETALSDAQDSANSESSWTVLVQDIVLENYTVDFEDRQPEIPVKLLLDSLQLHTSEFSTNFDKPLPIDLAFNLNQTGKADLKGAVTIEPLAVQLDVALSNIALPPFESYLSPFVQFDVEDGALSLAGKARYQDGAKTEPLVTFDGGLAIEQLALVDPAQAKPFVQWDALKLKDLNLAVEPTSVTLQEVALVKPALVMAMDPDGGLNFSRLFSPVGQEETDIDDSTYSDTASEQSDVPPTPVKIKTVRLENLQASIADLSVTPHVRTKIADLSGTIEGLSSEQLAKADVSIKGKVGGYAPLLIEGQINPLSEDAYTDLVLSFKNLDLTTVSPYSGKFAGYPITKGKITLNLDYKLSQKELVGENKVFVDQITMGKHVDSPDATSLPIPLALALLKDRKGKIDIDLPVRGNIDDPEFSYWGLIGQALVNLITKVAASPFSIVGGLVGEIAGGDADALQYVAFPAGEKEVALPEEEKLLALGKAIAERPGLRLEITGAADPDVDSRALAAAKLLLQLKKAKFVEQPHSNEEGDISIDQVKLMPEEKAQFFTKLYREKFGDAAATNSAKDSDNSEKASKQPTVEEMKEALLKDIPVDEGQLRLLAQQRAQHIQDFLIQKAQIPNDRVFLVEVLLTPEVEQDLVRSPLALGVN